MAIINGIDYPIHKAKFKQYLYLQSIQEKIEKTDQAKIQGHLICTCVSSLLSIDLDIVLQAPWKEVAIAYADILTANILELQLPFMKFRSAKKAEPLPWEYPDRDWHSYAHLFAKQYGWTLEYIAELSVEDALKLLQEILVDDQLKKEWEWDLSEKSSGYDEAAKKAKHIDLPRPDWMVVIPPPPKKIKMKRSFLPMGVILKPDGSHAELT